MEFGRHDTIRSPRALAWIKEQLPADVQEVGFGIAPGSKPDSVNGQYPRGIYVVRGDDVLMAQMQESSDLMMRWIGCNHPGSGLGKPFVNAIKKYADEKGLRFVAYNVTNQKFWNGFTWLTRKNENEYEYQAPRKMRFVG